jgi:hypothetical protein
MTALKGVVLWDRALPLSAGVPNLFGALPVRCQSVDEKAP